IQREGQTSSSTTEEIAPGQERKPRSAPASKLRKSRFPQVSSPAENAERRLARTFLRTPHGDNWALGGRAAKACTAQPSKFRARPDTACERDDRSLAKSKTSCSDQPQPIQRSAAEQFSAMKQSKAVFACETSKIAAPPPREGRKRNLRKDG